MDCGHVGLFGLFVGHPMGLNHVITNEVADELLNAEHKVSTALIVVVWNRIHPIILYHIYLCCTSILYRLSQYKKHRLWKVDVFYIEKMS